ncbi:MAG: PhnD/SsuA/transferrin family substrate-binding protein, partial [Erysipelothrix sp.]|nr:PhnD/SsuA/transferrin family substrate-binding protein [Erysipelothrix sp.]
MKLLRNLIVLTLIALLVVGCSSDKPTEGSNKIDDLKVVFVPSRDAKDIKEQTEPLKQLLIDELKKEGYEVSKVSIDTLTNYEAAGEALVSGSAHVGLIPGGTYAAY